MWFDVAPGGVSHQEQASDLFFPHFYSKLCIDFFPWICWPSICLRPISSTFTFSCSFPFSQWLICSCSKWISRKSNSSTGYCALLNAHLLLSAALPGFEWAWRGKDWHRRWRWSNLNLCIFIRQKSPGSPRVPLIRLHKTYSKHGIVYSESLNTQRCSLTMLHTA